MLQAWKNKAFETWCTSYKCEEHHVPGIGLNAIYQDVKGEPNPVGATEADIYKRTNKQLLDINLTKVGAIASFNLNYSRGPSTKKINEDTRPDIWTLTVQLSSFTLSEAIVWTLVLTGDAHESTINDCYINEFVPALRSGGNLIIKDCYIGTLNLTPGCVRNLTVIGGTIRSILAPAPGGGNPFRGSITFTNVDFPNRRSKSKLFKGPQQYRNLRAHLEELQNAPEVTRMRALELASERETDKGVTWFINWLYGTFANYGHNPGKPLKWAAVIYLVVAFYILLFDRGTTGVPQDWVLGWQSSLIEPGPLGDIRRSFLLPLQSLANPLGLFGTRKLIIASTGWGQTLLAIQGFICDVLLAMFVIAIRKRFKLH